MYKKIFIRRRYQSNLPLTSLPYPFMSTNDCETAAAAAVNGTLEIKALVRAGSLLDVHQGVLTSNSGEQQQVTFTPLTNSQV